MTRTAEFWNSAYDNQDAPWVIEGPQPAIVALERDGWIRGRVLDIGCGAGEHTILLTKLGYDVLGVDLAPSALAYARSNAAAQQVPTARFEVQDALELGDRPIGAYDTIIDSALFHVFGTDPEARATYVRNLHALSAPGGLVHVLALSNTEPGIGPRISDSVIRESFGDGWELENLQPARYLGHPTADEAGELNRSTAISDFAAWLARIRRS